MGKIFQENRPKNNADLGILISNKIDFKPMLIIRYKERHSHQGKFPAK